ncbi:MAG: LamG-like jellyroll fold domain-containing protein, partial [Rubripirellula sp.]
MVSSQSRRRSRLRSTQAKATAARSHGRRLIAEVLEPRTLLTTFFVNSLADGNPVTDGDLTLREALIAAADNVEIADAPAGSETDIIRFAPELFDSLEPGETAKIDVLGQFNVEGNTFIFGPGADKLSLDAGGNTHRVFATDFNSNTTISGLEVTGGGFGGIVNRGDLRLVDSVVRNNTSIINFGGGITSFGPSLTIEGSTIIDNTATGSGGGLASHGGNVRIENSTIFGNAAGGAGGGMIFVEDSFSSVPFPSVQLMNVTVSSNVAGQDGGGIAFPTGDMQIVHATITGNSSDFDGNGSGAGGGISVGLDTFNVTLTSSIIAGNFSGNLDTEVPNDVDGFVSGVFSHSNVIGDPSATASGLKDRNDSRFGLRNGNIIGDGQGGVLPIDRVLDPQIRTTNGVLVHTLGVDSVAIDQGLPNYAPLIAVDGAQVHLEFEESGEGIVVNRDQGDFRAADSTPIGGRAEVFLEGSPNLDVLGPTPTLRSAIEFDGVDDQLILNTSDLNDFTISFWINTTDLGGLGTTWQQGVPLIDNTFSGSAFEDFGLSLLNGRVAFGSGDGENTITSGRIDDGQWHHIAVTRSTSGFREMLTFVDGRGFGGRSGSATPFRGSGIFIGGRRADSRHFRGKLDEIAIFDTALSGSQIHQQFIAAQPGLSDQRGFPFRRSVFSPDPTNLRFGAPDAGAFERQPFSQTSAGVFEVSTIVDESDGNFGVGDLSLREAIELANLSPDHNRITFSEDLPQTLSAFGNLSFAKLELQHGSIPIHFDLTIDGLGSNDLILEQATLDESILTIAEVAMVDISGMSFTEAGDSAIVNFGQLKLDGIDFFSNESLINGGAILNSGQLNLTNSYFLDNFAAERGGAIFNTAIVDTGMTPTVNASAGVEFSRNRSGLTGGAISSEGVVNLEDVSVIQNTSSFAGGGIFSDGDDSVLNVRRSQIAFNRVDRLGGGIASEGTTSISNSTIRGNTSNDEGGGIVINLRTAPDDSDSFIRNSTISNNSAADEGGGIRIVGSPTAILEVSNSTIWGNTAAIGGGVHVGVTPNGDINRFEFNTIAKNVAGFGAGMSVDGNLNTLKSNIIGDNAGTDLMVDRGSIGISFNNIIESTNASFSSLNQVGVDPMLEGTLQNNGGPTQTAKLLAGSPAIDASLFSERLVDQRGFPVIDQEQLGGSGDDASDIGAYELEPIRIEFYESSTASFNNSGQQTSNTVSQFVEGDQQVQFGLGYTDGRPNSQLPSEPGFLGFQFDPDPYSFGGIGEGLFGDRYGAEVTLDFGGKAGIEYGYYIDAGSVAIDYDSMFRSQTQDVGSNTFQITTASFIDDGNLFTVSPRVGAYADLVFELNASISGVGCLVACTAPFSLPINLEKTVPLFSINRQEVDDNDQPVVSNGAPVLDGQLMFGAGSIGEILADEAGGAAESFLGDLSEIREDRRMAEMEMAAAEQDLRRNPDDQDARNRLSTAQGDVTRANTEEKSKSKKKDNGGIDLCAGTFVTACISAASDGLLGVEATLGVGAAAGPVSVSKPIGSIQVTVPEIALSDTSIDPGGMLSATTDDFVPGSREDNDRQIAKLSVDVAGVLGPFLGIPAGRYEAELGDVLSVSLQTLSYDVQPRLSATQDVQAIPYFHTNSQLDRLSDSDKRGAKLTLSPASNIVEVKVDGVSKGAVSEFWFQPGSTLEIKTNGQSVNVLPEVRMGQRFSNDIGLDIDVKGILEALAINVEIFGKTIVDIGPLIRYEHEIGNFDLGSVFKTDTPLNLSTSTDSLASFTLGEPINAVMDGQTPGGAFTLDVGVEN